MLTNPKLNFALGTFLRQRHTATKTGAHTHLPCFTFCRYTDLCVCVCVCVCSCPPVFFFSSAHTNPALAISHTPHESAGLAYIFEFLHLTLPLQLSSTPLSLDNPKAPRPWSIVCAGSRHSHHSLIKTRLIFPSYPFTAPNSLYFYGSENSSPPTISIIIL